jgi:hypothetical protein
LLLLVLIILGNNTRVNAILKKPKFPTYKK